MPSGPEIGGVIKVMTGNCRLKIREVFRKNLSSRPQTLLHGELCPENIFQGKSDRRAFVFSDFQMLHAGPPAIDLVQLLSTNLSNVDEYTDIDSYVERYYSMLLRHAAQNGHADVVTKYTSEMLMEDIRIGFVLVFLGELRDIYCCRS